MCTRAALAMFSLTMSWMPHATRGGDSRPPPPAGSTAARAAADVDRDLAAREVLGVQVAEEEVGVGDGRLVLRRARRHAGPGCDPALRGPTFKSPISSTWAMLPPPAPISISSIVEMRMGRPLPSMNRFWRAASKL